MRKARGTGVRPRDQERKEFLIVGRILVAFIPIICFFLVALEIHSGVVYVGRRDPAHLFVSSGSYSLKTDPQIFFFTLYFHIIAVAVLIFVAFLILKSKSKQ